MNFLEMSNLQGALGMKKWIAMISIGTMSLIIGKTSSALTASGNLAASLQVAATCQISDGSLDFGSYEPIATNSVAALDGVGGFSLACTRGATAKIALGNGLYNAHASGTSRAMSAAGYYLSYELYTDAARSVIWNDANRVNYASLSKNTIKQIAVYGRIPGGQNVPAQSYSDSVTITVSF